MSGRPAPVAVILGAGVGMGFVGDFLLRGAGEPGLNLALLFAGLAASAGVVSFNGGPRLSREAWAWLALGVVFGTGLVWRGSELLRFLAFLSASAAFALPAFRAGQAWVRVAGTSELVEAMAASGIHAIFGSSRLLQKAHWETVATGEPHRAFRTMGRSVAIGALLAALPLITFGALFLSADRVFAEMVGDFVRIDLSSFVSHLAVIAILSWLACGYLAGFSSGTRLDGLRTSGWARPTLGEGEVAIAVGLVDLLFLAFVIVQFRYLFGGAEMVEVTTGLTYAAYAREGFFQLVVATALGLPWLLVAGGLSGEGEESVSWTFRALAGVQLLLLLAIVASAVQRMRAYLDAYGLTEDRFVATAVLLWLALLVVWFGATALRSRRNPFAFGVVVSGFALIALLHLSNPTAYAARSHLDRGEAALHHESEPASRLDVSHLISLGSDATPILVARIHKLNAEARCEVAAALLSRWGPDREWNWRSWNLADRRARRVVRADSERLRSMAAGKECDRLDPWYPPPDIANDISPSALVRGGT